MYQGYEPGGASEGLRSQSYNRLDLAIPVSSLVSQARLLEFSEKILRFREKMVKVRFTLARFTLHIHEYEFI
jgi:hypothetical protein